MKLVKTTTSSKPAIIEPKLEKFYSMNGTPVVRISGNFTKGGFSLGKAKIAAILRYADVLKEFSDGNYDTQIDKLGENEVLTVSA